MSDTRILDLGNVNLVQIFFLKNNTIIHPSSIKHEIHFHNFFVGENVAHHNKLFPKLSVKGPFAKLARGV